MSVNVTFFVVDCYREITGREVAEMAGKGSEVGLKQDFSPEERAANGRKGGVKSGEARRRKRTIRETLQAMLDCQIPDSEKQAALKALGFDGTFRDAMSMAMLDKASRGDVEAGRFVRDSVGEKPREGVDVILDEKPLASIDMSKLSDEQLQQLAAQRAEQE
jgi:hypothetical protein